MSHTEHRLAWARRAANAAGDYLAAAQWDHHLVERKGAYDLHLTADNEAGARIRRLLDQEFPGETVLEEDGPPDTGTAEWVWIVDPLDGTVNYFHHLPWYCVSVACYHRTEASDHPLWRHGRPVASVVLAPAFRQEYWALDGQGAWNGDRRLSVSTQSLAEGLLSHSRGSRPDDQARMRSVLKQIGPSCRKTRSFGAAALDLAYVAQGSLVAHVQRSLQAWDIAAGVQLVLEAGGDFRSEAATDGAQHVLAGGPGVFDTLCEVLA